jgi:hypothetical protein
MAKKKKPEDYPLFTMRMSKANRERYEALATKYNISTAQLIREGLRVLEENPSFLDPTVNPYIQSIKEAQLGAHQERIDIENETRKDIVEMKKDIQTINRILEKFVTKGKPLTQKELKQAQQKDLSSEAIFE